MVEYSAITSLLLIGGAAGFLAAIPAMMNAFDQYLKGIYFMINLAIP